MISKRSAQQEQLREHMRGGNGTIQLTGLLESLPAHTRLFSRITIQPGCSIGYHVHENETEMFYFICGTAKVRDDDAEYVLVAGDAMATGSGHGHGVENIGDEPVEMVAVIIKD